MAIEQTGQPVIMMQNADIKIYNTFSQKKERLVPNEEGKLKVYVCGLTTYDYCHLGHGRMLVAFDVVIRYLRARGFEVTYVRNITDIDDKILRRAQENDELYSELTARYIAAMHDDERALHILPPDIEPRATAHIDQIIDMIETLIEKECAYRADNGDVYFAVDSFSEYGRLSKKKLEDLLAGARVDVGELKKDPRDFALWKTAGDDGVGWDSPWGYGRPGWHIECSAMATTCLGKNFDIHGGGSDLIFPHHENEIAQSECANGKKFANVWMHNGPLRVGDEKMSKSLGNFFTIRDVLDHHDAEVVRYFLISSHYRSPISYSGDSLAQSANALKRLYLALKDVETEGVKQLANSRFEKAFHVAMDDDFNTPEAMSVLFDLAKEINKHKSSKPEYAGQLASLLIRLSGVLGIVQRSPAEFLQSDAGQEVNAQEIETLIEQRRQAREDRDWNRADAIRDRLSELKVVVEDTVEGSSWRIER